jgi:radical SAM superfamily enzyme YgiQ (UPF0313 family)
MKPSVLLCYPSSFHCSIGVDDVDVKASLLVLGSYLARDYPVEYVDFEVAIGRPDSAIQIKRFERRVREYFAQHTCDILGLSCWTSMSYQATVLVAGVFRKLYPDKLIVVGGYHPTARPGEFRTPDRLFDYVVCGEGEHAMRDIVEAFAASGRPRETTVVRGDTTNSEEWVSYNWDLIDPFVRSHFPEGLAKLYILLSRGCPFECSFCMESLKERRWRALSPRQALDQLDEAVRRYRPRIVGIADACFGLNPGWRKEFLGLLARSAPTYQVIFETRAESLDTDDVKQLAGLDVEVQFGIESGSPQILRLMRKTRQPERYLDRFRRISRTLTEHRILHRANLIFNHPGETEQTLRETFSFIDGMMDTSESYLMWICRPYMHYPGCELDNNRPHYERTFGSQFFSPEWWKEDCDQYLASLNSVPSRDLAGDRKELWGRMLTEREERFRTGLSTPAFRYAAEKYFPEWLEDSRYRKI